MKAVCFSNLTCWLGGREILKNISGEVVPGKVTAILGANGCGKSTLLRALLGFVPLQSGKVEGVSKSLGYLPQAKEVYWPLTCEAIIRLGSQEPGTKNQEKILERLGIEHLKDKRIDEVSGGERTLVLLARVLRDQPELIVVDEPVSELDPAYQIQVMKVLREEALRGAVVLATMHDVNLTAQFADWVFLIQDGKIFKQGVSQEMINSENLAKIFSIPFVEGRALNAK